MYVDGSTHMLKNAQRHCEKKMLSDKKTNTVNPLYNDIRHNSTIHYNANSVRTKTNESRIFSLTVPCYSLGKHTF